MASSRRSSSRRRAASRKTPYVALGLGALAVACAVRGLYRPSRALVDAATMAQCPGKGTPPAGCAPVTVELTAPSPVYALGTGQVVHVAPGLVAVALSTEPVVLEVHAPSGALAAGIEPGAHVAIGQVLMTAPKGATVGLAVTEVLPRDSGGGPYLRPLDPLAWLVARGRTLSRSGTPAAACGVKGREYQASAPAGGCEPLALPQPSKYLILPVSVTQATYTRGA